MSKKIRWIKPVGALRFEGMVEDADSFNDGIVEAWVKGGYVEVIHDDATTTAQEQAEDLARRQEPVAEKAVHDSPVDRSAKSRRKP